MFPTNMKAKNFHLVFLSILITLAVFCSTTTVPAHSANVSTAEILIDPQQTVLTNVNVGASFKINVTLANITGLAGLEFQVHWNSSLLSCTGFTENLFAAITPSGETDNIWVIKKATNNTGGFVHYAVTFQDTDRAITGGYAPINITTDLYPEGKLAAAILTFNVTQIPNVNGVYTDTFDFGLSVKAGDISATPIPVTSANGYYTIYGPPETSSNNVVKDGTTYVVTSVSNASVVSGSMTYVQNWTITFNLTGTGGTTGYVNVTIPKDLVRLNQTADLWTVKVNDTLVTPIISENATHTSLYITASLSTETVTVTGTIPEFPMLMAIPLLMVVTLIAIGLRRRRRI